MKIQWVATGDDAHSKTQLAKHTAGDLIPAEKKPYLTVLEKSAGPFMTVETAPGKVGGILDAASQIATLGLGFNPNAFFGVGQHLESWLNLPEGGEAKDIRRAYRRLMGRKLGWDWAHMFLCHSGAEANEVALGACFERRVNPGARKVLAFEGSFHGRMLVGLSATWSPPKREPFEIPGYTASFVPYPDMDDDKMSRPIPEGWQALWAEAPSTRFSEALGAHKATQEALRGDALLQKEIDCLLKVRERLLGKEIFAIMLEPMQCEGGDRYSSGRFHHALLNMARACRIPLVYDEVQTGFRLGRRFFWHQMFELKGPTGERLYPDYVTCAKKAQVGVVLSHEPIPFVEHYSVASMVRGYTQGFILDQYRDDIQKLEKMAEKEVLALIKKNPNMIQKPRICGLSFSFEFKESKKMDEFIAKRFGEGLLYYPAGTHTARFRLNLGFGAKELKALFARMDLLIKELEKPSGKASKAGAHDLDAEDPALKYEFHRLLLDWKLQGMKAGAPAASKKDLEKALDWLSGSYLKGSLSKLSVRIIDGKLFKKLRLQITQIQKRNYEPVRQTKIEQFEKGMADKNTIFLGLMEGAKLHGIAFGSALRCFPYERGVRADKHFADPKAIYMLDTTIDKKYQGYGLGKLMKFAVALMAHQKGVERIQGRNRTRVAASMLNINASLGAYEQRYIREDYADEERYRDVVYYTCPLQWKRPRLNLSNGILSPLGADELNGEFFRQTLPYMVNKICLSNFVSEDFAKSLSDFSQLLPAGLRHLYTSSGLTECVDKITKTLWHHRKPKIRMMTFEGCFFGHGSFMSRSLSGQGEPFFPVDRLPFPTLKNQDEVLSKIKDLLRAGQHLAVWAEPLSMLSMERMPEKFLVALRKLCSELDVALVYNETASQWHRFQLDGFFAASRPEIEPDLGFAFLGGQMGVVFCKERFFIKTPLMMISTWDGDEYAMQAYMHAAQAFAAGSENYKQKVRQFETKLRNELQKVNGLEFFVENGTGWFRGAVPESISRYFDMDRGGKRYLICPSASAINRYLSENG